VTALTFDPANGSTNGNPDHEVAEATLATLQGLLADFPALYDEIAAIETALAATGEDQDDDDLTDEAEAAITTQLGRVITSVRPAAVREVVFDPTDAESTGANDATTASQVVSAAESAALQLTVAKDNRERLLPAAEEGLRRLRQAAADQKWVIDIEGVAAGAFGGDGEQAARAVGLFNAYCARCHTSGWSAGVVFTQEAGSGGFGPALWEGRPNVQFLAEADLIKFITEGSAAQQAYGVNGIGSGRMPGFGMVLSAEDIRLIAVFLRSGNLTGLE
jgi:mono/diheme cytochrome c family protein